MQHHSIFN